MHVLHQRWTREQAIPLASILQKTHPLEREVEREKRARLFVDQVSFSSVFVAPVSKPSRRVRQ